MTEPRDRLVGRVTGSDLIVSGVVSEVRAMPPAPGAARRVSEHDPDWHEAVVEVESVGKGTVPTHGVVVAFPLSRDVAWHTSPKFAVGDRGVWLLRSGDTSEVAAEQAAAMRERPVAPYTALDPLDFQPEADADAVASFEERGAP